MAVLTHADGTGQHNYTDPAVYRGSFQEELRLPAVAQGLWQLAENSPVGGSGIPSERVESHVEDAVRRGAVCVCVS